MESDLIERQQTISRLETEISRLRREDHASRRTHDGLEHLQAKVESLTAMNSFLKDQTETRERTIRSLEDRLRHQQEEMRRPEEVDAQSQKLKRRNFNFRLSKTTRKSHETSPSRHCRSRTEHALQGRSSSDAADSDERAENNRPGRLQSVSTSTSTKSHKLMI